MRRQAALAGREGVCCCQHYTMLHTYCFEGLRYRSRSIAECRCRQKATPHDVSKARLYRLRGREGVYAHKCTRGQRTYVGAVCNLSTKQHTICYRHHLCRLQLAGDLATSRPMFCFADVIAWMSWAPTPKRRPAVSTGVLSVQHR